jgi:hypothetical protein
VGAIAANAIAPLEKITFESLILLVARERHQRCRPDCECGAFYWRAKELVHLWPDPPTKRLDDNGKLWLLHLQLLSQVPFLLQ